MFRRNDRPQETNPAALVPARPTTGAVEVTLDAVGDKKIAVIKAIRGAFDFGLKDAMTLTDAAAIDPISLGWYGVDTARRLRAEIVEAGGEATIHISDGGAPDTSLAQIGKLAVWADCLITPEGDSYVLTPKSTASVDATGAVEVTRGRNLAAKAAGGLLLPGGAFVFGNARDRVHDGRELYLTFEDPGWHYVVAVHPDLGREARDLAAAFRRAAGATGALGGSATPVGALGTDSLMTTLERLAALHERGALTDAEFAAQKAKLLGA